MMRTTHVLSRLLPVLGLTLVVQVQAEQVPSRGAMLYEAQCVACHTTQVHWRARKLATDWQTLEAQVRRWQNVASVRWSEDDIAEVTRHLNDTFYKFEPPRGRVGALKAGATGAPPRVAIGATSE